MSNGIHSKIQAAGYTMVGTAPLVTLIVWAAPMLNVAMGPTEAAALASVITALLGWVAGYLKRELVHKPNPPARRISSPKTS